MHAVSRLLVLPHSRLAFFGCVLYSAVAGGCRLLRAKGPRPQRGVAQGDALVRMMNAPRSPPRTKAVPMTTSVTDSLTVFCFLNSCRKYSNLRRPDYSIECPLTTPDEDYYPKGKKQCPEIYETGGSAKGTPPLLSAAFSIRHRQTKASCDR